MGTRPCPKATPDPKCAAAVGAPEDLRRCARAVPRLVAPICRLGVQLMRIVRQLGAMFSYDFRGCTLLQSFLLDSAHSIVHFLLGAALSRLEQIPAKEYGGFPPESNYLFLGA